MRRGLILFTGLFCLFSGKVTGQTGGREYTCMFYNVENLFHPSDDPAKAGDDDFTPEGTRRWTYYRYNRKIAAISKVILAANGWDPPAIIGLAEIENRTVLNDLVNHPLLARLQYNILHREGPDHRGIDVAILYRADMVHCIDTSWITVTGATGKAESTREILEARFILQHDTILFAMNHWTSRYGGTMETEPKRIRQAEILGERIGKLTRDQPGLKVIAGGDFNDYAGSASLETLTGISGLKEVHPSGGSHTYKYQGKWESLDHVLVGGALNAEKCRATVPGLQVLLENDVNQTGMRPWRTYGGYAYNGGVSDHLPLLLHFRP